MTGLVGFAGMRDWDWHAAVTMMAQQIVDTGANYGLSVIPLFLLMGVFIHRANISQDLFDASNALVGRFRGGLAQSTVLACAGFAAVSGSSLATAATMTKVAMPHMRRYGYDDTLSAGVIAAGGTLGIMIPPSVPLVIYGLVAEQDIGRLFIAGFAPGSLLVALYMAAVFAVVWLRPELGPAGAAVPRGERLRTYLNVWPVLALFVLVLGGIYFGVFTPTEASGIGATGAAAFAWWRGRLRSFAQLYEIAARSLPHHRRAVHRHFRRAGLLQLHRPVGPARGAGRHGRRHAALAGGYRVRHLRHLHRHGDDLRGDRHPAA